MPTYDEFGNAQPTPLEVLQEQTKQKQLELQKIQAFADAGLNPDGTPKPKAFESNLDPSTGLLKAPYQMTAVDPSKMQSFDLLKQLATGTGLTESGKLREKQIKQDTLQNKEAAAREAMSGGAAARNAMAMRGGMSSGARERIATGMGSNLLEARQAANRAGQSNILQNLLSDQQRRDQGLTQFAGLEKDITGANKDIEKYNITGALTESNAKRAYEQEQYKQQLDKWASEKQAEATRNSGGGGKK